MYMKYCIYIYDMCIHMMCAYVQMQHIYSGASTCADVSVRGSLCSCISEGQTVHMFQP